MRVLRPIAVALFVLAIAVTPLTAVTAEGHFEYRYPPRHAMDLFGHRIVVDDQTGMVAAIGPTGPDCCSGSVSNLGGSGNTLVVEWLAGGCDAYSQLVIRRSAVGYTIDITSGGRTCPYLDLRGYAILLKLWSPIDAASVDVVSEFGS
jgi:hypothetical protein